METVECYEKWTYRSEDDTFHTNKTENFKEVDFIKKMLPWNWLKWRRKSVPKKCCGYFSHPLDVYEASLPEEVLDGPADIVVETRAKTCSESFFSGIMAKLKRKDWTNEFRVTPTF